MSCHDYEGIMLVLCTPLQVKYYPLMDSPKVNHISVQIFIENGPSLLEIRNCTFRKREKKKDLNK